MHRESLVGLLAIALASSLWAAESTSWDFEAATVGQSPQGWIAAKTGEGPGSVWQVAEDPKAPAGPKVLMQTSSEGPKPLFNLCVAEQSRFADLDLTVSLKAVRGKIDQGGGPLWRYQDPGNYYVCRVNPLEGNFRLYKLVDGKRVQLASADADTEQGQWSTIRVVHKGNYIQCYLDGQKLLEATDDALAQPGRVGLWTKADAVTAFDALRVAP